MNTSNPYNARVSAEERIVAPVPPRVVRGRVLVIDDEPLLGRTLRLAFQEDHEVVVVTSGRQALELLATDADFDLILCDLMMPDMNGMQVYERMLQERPSILDRLVFMTGGAYTAEAREFLDQHLDAQLEKPFDMARFEGLLRHKIRRRQVLRGTE
jgi:two-component system, cell cycle sensor histidine kinase and response regulator CckA